MRRGGALKFDVAAVVRGGGERVGTFLVQLGYILILIFDWGNMVNLKRFSFLEAAFDLSESTIYVVSPPLSLSSLISRTFPPRCLSKPLSLFKMYL